MFYTYEGYLSVNAVLIYTSEGNQEMVGSCFCDFNVYFLIKLAFQLAFQVCF